MRSTPALELFNKIGIVLRYLLPSNFYVIDVDIDVRGTV
jgi:hypothetical protein